jgi:hypothetical protein
MKVSIAKFVEHLKVIKGHSYQHIVHADVDHLHGVLAFDHQGTFPYYDVVNDKWSSFEDVDDSWKQYEMEYNYRADGKFDFGILSDGSEYSSFYIYSPIEFMQFISIVNKLSTSDILNMPPVNKVFNLSDVVKKLYVTFKDDNGRIQLCDVNVLRRILSTDDFRSLLRVICFGDWDFLVKNGNLNNYFETNKIPVLNEYYGNISLLFNSRFINVTSPNIDFDLPHLAFELSPDFSSQYFCDLMFNTKYGKEFMDSLWNLIFDGKSFKTLNITAPKDLIGQFLYSSAFRSQYHYYLQVTNNPNFLNKQMLDLKSICIDIRENFQEYFLKEEHSNFFDIIKHPLPYILEKTNRSYIRSTSDFDRQTYGGRLFNYILRSIVIYPLQELVYLQINKTNTGINKVLSEIQSGNLISDGTWISWFNDIAKIIGKDSNIKLEYFNFLLQNFQKQYREILDSIPKRNDWAHYRDHSVEYQKHLDKLLPKLISSLREAFKNIDIIYIEKQEYKTSHELVITAKKIMGYEIDIETIEFSTKLPGNYFISKKLYAYKQGSNYTIPLEPFFDLKFETVETIRMGIFENNLNGEYKYVY